MNYKREIFTAFIAFACLVIPMQCLAKMEYWENFYNLQNITNYQILQKHIFLSLSGDYSRFEEPAYKELKVKYFMGPFLDLIEQGNVYAIKLGFQVFPLFRDDGEAFEELHISLAKTIKLNPQLFLESLETYKIGQEYTARIVFSLDQEFEEEWAKRILEYEKRISALECVTSPELLKTRDFCIEKLKNEIEFLNSVEQNMPNN